MDIIDDKQYDERDQIGGRKENELDSEESGTDYRYQIENLESLQRIDN